MEIWLRSFPITQSALRRNQQDFLVEEFEAGFRQMETEEKFRWFPMFLKEKTKSQQILEIAYYEGLRAWLPLQDWGHRRNELKIHPSYRTIVISENPDLPKMQKGLWGLFVVQGEVREFVITPIYALIIDALGEDLLWQEATLVQHLVEEAKTSELAAKEAIQELRTLGLI